MVNPWGTALPQVVLAAKSESKTRLVALHPVSDLAAFARDDGVVQIYNYRTSSAVQSFSPQQLDDSARDAARARAVTRIPSDASTNNNNNNNPNRQSGALTSTGIPTGTLRRSSATDISQLTGRLAATAAAANLGIDVDEGHLEDLEAEDGDAEDGKKLGEFKHEKVGGIVQLVWYDAHVLLWQRYVDTTVPAGEIGVSGNGGKAQVAPDTSGALPAAVDAAVGGPTWLTVVCEHAVLFFDYLTGDLRVLRPGPGLDAGKASITSMTSISTMPWIVLGLSDGGLRVFDLATWSLRSKLTGGHSKAVSALLSYCPRALQSAAGAYIVSGGADGALCIWNMGSLTLETQLLKVHDGAVNALSFNPHSQELASTGADRALKVHLLHSTLSHIEKTAKAVAVIKSPFKHPLTSLAHWPHPAYSISSVIVSDKSSHLIMLIPDKSNAEMYSLCDVSALPNTVVGDGEFRVYHVDVHPLNPHIIGVATSAGLVVLSAEPGGSPNTAPVPLSKQSQGVAYFESRSKVHRLNVVSRPGRTPVVKAEALARVDNRDGAVSLSMSPSGRFLSVFWLDHSTYVVYAVGKSSPGSSDAPTLHRITTGAAESFAWASNTPTDQYAVLEPVNAPKLVRGGAASGGTTAERGKGARASLRRTVMIGSVRRGSTSSRDPSVDSPDSPGRRQSVDRRSTSNRSSPSGGSFAFPVLVVRRLVIGEDGDPASAVVDERTDDLKLPQLPSGTFGGPFLAVPYGIRMSGLEGEVLPIQFVSWKTLKPVGPLVPKPELLLWDESGQWLVLGYTDHFSVFQAASGGLQYVVSHKATLVHALWYHGTLLVVTPSSVAVAFVHKDDFQLVTLASSAPPLGDLSDAAGNDAFAALGASLASPGSTGGLTPSGGSSGSLNNTMNGSERMSLSRIGGGSRAPIGARSATGTGTGTLTGSGSYVGSQRVTVTGTMMTGGGRDGLAGDALGLGEDVPVVLRPAGPLMLVSVIEDQLVMMDPFHQVHFLSLAHPVLKFMFLVGAGELGQALEWVSAIHPRRHDDLAAFLETRGHAREALSIPTVSAWHKLAICKKFNLLEEGITILDGLARPLVQGPWADGLTSVARDGGASPEHRELVKSYMSIAESAEKVGEAGLAAACLYKACQLDVRAYRALVFLRLRQGATGELRNLFESLAFQKLWREAELVATVLGDRALLKRAHIESGQWSFAAAGAAASGGPGATAPVLAQWNSELEAKAVSDGVGKLFMSSSATEEAGDNRHVMRTGGLHFRVEGIGGDDISSRRR